MTTPLKFARDEQSAETFGPEFADQAASASIGTSATPYTVPLSTEGDSINFLAIFTYEPGSEVWVANGATAEVPVGATFATTLSSQNPVSRQVTSGDILSCISATVTTSVGIEFYAI